MCTAMARNKSTDPREHTGTRARRGEYPRRCAAPGLQVERLLDPSSEPTMTAFGPDDPAQGGVGAPGAGNLLHREPTKIKVEGINLTYSGLIPQIQKSFLSKDVEAMQPHVRAFVERAVGAEALRARVPFGGFPWGRVAFGQPNGPLLPVAALGGAPLLSFVTVLAGLALGETARRLARGQVKPAAVPAGLALAALLVGPLAALVPPTAGGPERTVTIAAVQGNVPRLGLDFNAQRRAVLDNHVRVTEQLAADVAAGREPQPDLVIWPENSSDIDPLRNADAAAQIDRAARAIKAPILVGAVLINSDGLTTSNSALVWQGGIGPIERNDKRRVQPFGEYLPWREFFALFSSYADRAGYFVPGPGSGAVDMAGVRVGIAICWEIAFDDLVADSVDAGAQVLAVPSNNATFGLSEMTYQQLAMSRVRAVEHDRPVIVATTSGVSATITREGAVTASTRQFTPDVLVDRTVLRDTTTLASQLRAAPGWVLVAVALVAVALGFVGRRRALPAKRKDEHG